MGPRSRSTQVDDHHSPRLKLVLVAIYGLLLTVCLRLGYWQIIKGEALQAQAEAQYQHSRQLSGHRGQIFLTDQKLLVGNQTVYRLFAEPQQLTRSAEELTALLLPHVLLASDQYQDATEAATKTALETTLKTELLTKLSNRDSKWVRLSNQLPPSSYEALKQLGLEGIGFDPYLIRWYPEASLAAHVTGFVGKTQAGEDVGYFGVEGSLDKELKIRPQLSITERDALGLELAGQIGQSVATNGRDVTLTIRRDIQSLIEEYLATGLQRYGAKVGEIIVLEPATGHILAMAAMPDYAPAEFIKFSPELYRNPSVAAAYEPGSTFKTLTVAAGIDAGVIQPDTPCPICTGPRQIAGYLIKTWNNQYHPDITMTEALAKSDNTAMMYITDLLGADRFSAYLRKFGIGQKTYVELQEDTTPPYLSKWGPVELATTSFGQGISVTSLQLVKAVASIANHGVLMRPQIVASVTDPHTGQTINTQPYSEGQPISASAAATVAQMMVRAAEAGEAQWIASKTHGVAGKTGTSQVAVNGTYDETKTIATYIGFAPVNEPKFIMLVKLVEPSSSPWAAETAAPLWYQIASKLYLLLEIPPDQAGNKPATH